MKLGAERKKVMILGGLIVVALGIYFWPSSDERQEAAAASKTAARPNPAQPAIDQVAPSGPAPVKPNISRARAMQQGRSSQEFRPGLSKDPVSPDKVDPTLRLDL